VSEDMAQERTNTSKTAEKAGAMGPEEWHDLLPIEKKLIFSSLTLGIVLLVIFVFAFGVFH
jgi:hypothetical protein